MFFDDDVACTVLVVDDDEDTREMMRDVLAEQGFAVLTASDGKRALDMLEAGARVDCITLDNDMPVLDGQRFLVERSLSERLASIPVVVVSAWSRVMRFPGVVAQLKKPVDVSRLVATVSRAARAHALTALQLEAPTAA